MIIDSGLQTHPYIKADITNIHFFCVSNFYEAYWNFPIPSTPNTCTIPQIFLPIVFAHFLPFWELHFHEVDLLVAHHYAIMLDAGASHYNCHCFQCEGAALWLFPQDQDLMLDFDWVQIEASAAISAYSLRYMCRVPLVVYVWPVRPWAERARPDIPHEFLVTHRHCQVEPHLVVHVKLAGVTFFTLQG